MGDMNRGGRSPSEKIILVALLFFLHGDNMNVGNDVNVCDDTNNGVNLNDEVDANVGDNANE